MFWTVPSWSCSQAVSKPVWHIPLLCVQWKTPDDGQRNCPKHVEFHSEKKFEKLVHLVGFIVRKLSWFTVVPSWSCLQAVSKPVWHIPLLCVQWKTPDDGQRNCPKHVKFNSKNKFEKLVHLVGFIIRKLREKLCIHLQDRCRIIMACQKSKPGPHRMKREGKVFLVAAKQGWCIVHD